jgi:hypothetical protein
LGLKLGIEDPEQWLEQCPDRVFDNWLAYYRLEPFGMEDELLAKVVSLLYFVCKRPGTELEDIQKFSDAVVRCLMPANWVGQQSDRRPQSIDVDQLKKNFAAAQQLAAKAFG